MSEKSSYNQILKSSSIIGGAAGVNLVLGMVRTKFAAVLIGTTGVGLIANYSVIQSLVGTVAGLGIHSSAVRDVTISAAKSDQQKIARVVLSLRRICWLTGLFGAFTLIAISPFVSQWVFGSRDFTLEVALLGIVILLGNLSGGQIALLQGLRRIGDIARVNIFSATIGTIITIGFYSRLGLDGIVPAILLIAAVVLVFNYFYVRRVPLQKAKMTWGESLHAVSGMIRLGIAFMWSTLIASLVGFSVNVIITRQFGLEALGIYSAAFALSGLFVNFVLGAMGTDFYPRLTEAAHNHEQMNRLVNEQAEIGMLLGLPGLLATMSLATWVIYVFYVGDFMPAVSLIPWFILGCMQRVVSWPLGFVLRSMGKEKLFVVTETIFHGSHLLLVYVAVSYWQLEGAAIAFFMTNTLVTIIIYTVIRKLIGFRWSPANIRLFFLVAPVMLVTFALAKVLPVFPLTAYGVIVSCLASFLCLSGLVSRLGNEHRLSRIALRIPFVKSFCHLQFYR